MFPMLWDVLPKYVEDWVDTGAIVRSLFGEDGTEMGAFNRALDPIKRDDLAAKLAEYAPVQARVQIVTVT